jgi:hypothetical protein
VLLLAFIRNEARAIAPLMPLRIFPSPGRSVSEGGRCSSASAGPRSDQESRSVTVWPGLAFPWKAGMTPSPERQERKPDNAREECQDPVRRL